MRDDLAGSFISTINSEFRSPLQYAVFHFSFGDVYLSDRDIDIDGNQCRGIIEDWGELVTSGYGVSDIISETLEISLSIWNGGNNPFSDYFIIDEPLNVFVDIYQTFSGLSSSDSALIGTFVIQDPLEWSESSRLLQLDLVSINMTYSATVGDVVTKADWPNAQEDSIGKGIDLLLGDAGYIELIPLTAPPRTQVKSLLTTSSTKLYAKDDLIALGFPTSGTIRIDKEVISYSSRTSKYFYLGIGNYPKSKHNDGEEIVQVLSSYVYGIGQGPIDDVTDIRVDNDPSAKIGARFIIDKTSDLATITTATELRRVISPDESRIFRIEFDTVSGTSTAINPEGIFEDNFEYAEISLNKQLVVYHNITSAEFLLPSDIYLSNIMIEIESNEDTGSSGCQLHMVVPEKSTYGPGDGYYLNANLYAGQRQFIRFYIGHYPIRNNLFTIKYTGTSPTCKIKIYRAYYEGIYSGTDNEVDSVYSTYVTCRVKGSSNNRPDQVIQHLLHNRAGVPLELLSSTWASSFPVVPPASGSAFEEAASRYEALGYRLDGAISAGTSISEAIKNICKQSRGSLIWSAGKAKLYVREKSEDWSTLKYIGKDDVQLRSMVISKSEATNIYNEINLFYKVDRLSDLNGEAKYNASVYVNDAESILVHGVKKDNSEWTFDLVRDSSMAEDLADYYIWRYGRPITRYTFNTYLPQFDLEKGDTLRLTSDFYKLTNLPVRIVNNTRTFGSGKLGIINKISFTCESIRAVFLSVNLSDTFDTVNIEESVAITHYAFVHLYDSAAISDSIGITHVAFYSLNDAAYVVDSIYSEQGVKIREGIGFGLSPFGGEIIDEECTTPFGSPCDSMDPSDNEDSVSISEELTFTIT